MSLELRDIPGFPGYRAGSDGFIYSYRKRGKGKRIWYELPPKRLKSRAVAGYLQVKLMLVDCECKHVKVHRMVASAFHGKPPRGREASHLDGNARNNKPDNVAWETKRQNAQRRKQHGTQQSGRDHWNAVTPDRTEAARVLLAAGTSRGDVAIACGVSRSVVDRIANGEHYSTR